MAAWLRGSSIVPLRQTRRGTMRHACDLIQPERVAVWTSMGNPEYLVADTAW